MPTPNTQIGEISSFNVAIQGNNPNMQATSDKGSILAVKYIKDAGADVTNPSNITTIELKNWFADYVGTIGKFNKQRTDDVNIKWSDYKGATILGFKVEAMNEGYNKYKSNNNAKLRITPINGSTNNFNVVVGGWSSASTGGAVVSAGFDAQGSSKSVTIQDLTTGVNISMAWNPGYNSDGYTSITSSNTTGGSGLTFPFSWPGGDRADTWSNPMYFFMGPAGPSRPYGENYPN